MWCDWLCLQEQGSVKPPLWGHIRIVKTCGPGSFSCLFGFSCFMFDVLGTNRQRSIHSNFFSSRCSPKQKHMWLLEQSVVTAYVVFVTMHVISCIVSCLKKRHSQQKCALAMWENKAWNRNVVVRAFAGTDEMLNTSLSVLARTASVSWILGWC